jgi:hypothetical protein
LKKFGNEYDQSCREFENEQNVDHLDGL